MALTRRKRDHEHDATVDTDRDTSRDTDRTTVHDVRAESGTDAAREKFGGVNLGAAVFGWLVAVAVGIILTSVIGALVTAVGSEAQISQSDAEREASA